MWKLLFFVQLVLVLSICEGANNCGSGWVRNPFTETCLIFVNQQKSWDDAKDHCSAFGANLATFPTLESFSWFTHTLKTRPSWQGDIWIGGKRFNTNEWKWVGHFQGDLVFDQWSEGEPNNLGAVEHCIHVRKGHGYLLNDVSCNNGYPFMCEK